MNADSRTWMATMAAMVLAAFHLIGCAAIGPPTVARDRLDFSVHTAAVRSPATPASPFFNGTTGSG